MLRRRVSSQAAFTKAAFSLAASITTTTRLEAARTAGVVCDNSNSNNNKLPSYHQQHGLQRQQFTRSCAHALSMCATTRTSERFYCSSNNDKKMKKKKDKGKQEEKKKDGGEEEGAATKTKSAEEGDEKNTDAKQEKKETPPAAPPQKKEIPEGYRKWRRVPRIAWLANQDGSSSSSSSSSVSATSASVASPLTRLLLQEHGEALRPWFLGEKLGPHPLVVLPGVVNIPPTTTATSGSEESKKQPSSSLLSTPLDGILAALQHTHGALCIPLPTLEQYEKAALTMQKQQQQEEQQQQRKETEKGGERGKEEENTPMMVMPSLSYLQVCSELVAVQTQTYKLASCNNFSHVLSYSTGSLVAASMCLYFPEKIGCLVNIDTPLLTQAMVSNAKLRDELREAYRDVNVPREMISYTEQQLLEEDLERAPTLPPLSTKRDKEVFGHIFETFPPQAEGDAAAAAGGGASGKQKAREGDVDYSRYVAPQLLASIRHPLMLVTSETSRAGGGGGKGAATAESDSKANKKKSMLFPLCDVNGFKQWFSVRRHLGVKGCADHASLLHHPGIAETTTADSSSSATSSAAAATEGQQQETTATSTAAASNTSAAAAATTDGPTQIAQALSHFLQRYDMDAVILKKWDVAKEEMGRLVATAAAGGKGAADAGAGAEGGKKSKKKKEKKAK